MRRDQRAVEAATSVIGRPVTLYVLFGVVALWEQSEHGSLVAPIVRDVIKAYFDKKIRVAHGPAQVAWFLNTPPGASKATSAWSPGPLAIGAQD